MSVLLSPAFLAFLGALLALGLALGSRLLRRRGSGAGAFEGALLAVAIERGLAGQSLRAGQLGEAELWQLGRVGVLGIALALWLLFSLTYARLNADLFLRRWRPVWIAALIVPAVLTAAFAARFFSSLDSSAEERWILQLGPVAKAVSTLLIATGVLALANLERTYRAAAGTSRWRIKFMVFGAGLISLIHVFAQSQALVYGRLTASMEVATSIGLILGMALLTRHLLRNSRFDSEVYPSRSVIQGSVILLGAGAYFVVVGVLANLAARFGGISGFALKSFVLLGAITVLVVLAQSDRLRMLLRRAVSRHFQRPVYDYQSIWRQFSEKTAGSGDAAELGGATVGLSAEVFHALSVTLRLVDDGRERLEVLASTALTAEKAAAATPTAEDVGRVLAHFEAKPVPVNVDLETGEWAEAVRRWHPNTFPGEGGHRLCAPLHRGGRVIGLLVVGDRVSGVSFPEQDLDLLACVADHVTTRLVNLQFAQRLLQAKELEAFQAMATFFVHDLKNAASTLNLMLQNLPLHFNDPAFREDALRGMGKTVAHMNRLIVRLGQLRHDLRIDARPQDLSALVADSLAELAPNAKQRFTSELPPQSPAPIDPEQLRKVVTNLVLNAIEATPADGEIRVRTFAQGPHVCLEVTDTGCGMTPEFIQRQLFRPFQTTKKTGLGIGMFQSKMIVEAHGGRLTASSTPGRGTRFQVLLPIHGK